MFCGGCLSGSATKQATKQQEPTKVNAVITTDPADADVYSSDPKHPDAPRVKLWNVAWQKIDLSVTNKGINMGRMTGVHGLLMSGSAKGVTVTSDSGAGDAVAKLLHLAGNVVVTSADRKSKMFCDSLEYDSAKQLLYADGNVKLSNQVGSIGTFSRLMSTADFHRIGTPQEFAHL